jgi:hypothetical protein
MTSVIEQKDDDLQLVHHPYDSCLIENGAEPCFFLS